MTKIIPDFRFLSQVELMNVLYTTVIKTIGAGVNLPVVSSLPLAQNGNLPCINGYILVTALTTLTVNAWLSLQKDLCLNYKRLSKNK